MTPEAFFEKFGLFADLSDAVARMRHLVLELAIEGKLVARDPNEASVEVSLPRLAAATVPPSGFNPYPEHWLQMPLGDAGTWYGGGTPSKARKDFWIGDVPWVSPKDMKVLLIDDAEDHVSEAAIKGSAARIVPPGSLLMVVRGMILVRAFPVAQTTRSVTINQDMKALFLSEPEAAPFILVALRAMEAQVLASVERSSHGTCKLRTEVLEHLIVPLPPLAEQKRIVAKVDELMALCDRLEAQQKERETRHAALARASLSRFADAPTPANLTFLFHKSYTIPPADLRKSILTLAVQGNLVPRVLEAPFASLESVLAEASVNGVSKGPTADSTATEILRISAGTSRSDFYVDENDFKHVDLPAHEIEKFQLAPNDLLACRFNGNLHFVGRFSLYRGESGRVQVNPDKLIRFRVDTKRCCSRYVCYAMNASPTRSSIEAMCATTAGNIGLSAGRLKTVHIPLPPLAEQRRIVAKVDQLMALVDQLEAQLAASRATAARLLDAIVGELTA